MKNFNVVTITPFIGVKDFEISAQFYKDLGFIPEVTTDTKILFKLGDFGFWLQDYYIKEWVDNSMLCLYVEDINSWFELIQSLNLDTSYEKQARLHSEPHEQEGGIMMQLIDPAGVLWHIRQNQS